jgi:hypothetical protein
MRTFFNETLMYVSWPGRRFRPPRIRETTRAYAGGAAGLTEATSNAGGPSRTLQASAAQDANRQASRHDHS